MWKPLANRPPSSRLRLSLCPSPRILRRPTAQLLPCLLSLTNFFSAIPIQEYSRVEVSKSTAKETTFAWRRCKARHFTGAGGAFCCSGSRGCSTSSSHSRNVAATESGAWKGNETKSYTHTKITSLTSLYRTFASVSIVPIPLCVLHPSIYLLYLRSSVELGLSAESADVFLTPFAFFFVIYLLDALQLNRTCGGPTGHLFQELSRLQVGVMPTSSQKAFSKSTPCICDTAPSVDTFLRDALKCRVPGPSLSDKVVLTTKA